MGLIDVNNLKAFYNRIKNVFVMRTRLDTTGSSTSKTQAVAANVVNTFLNIDMVNMVYPVGSIYMSVNNTNPSTFLGGTWVAWGQGRVPVGVSTTDANYIASEKTGGSIAYSADHSHTVKPHTHSVDAHNHTMNSHTHSVNAHSHSGASYVAGVGAVNNAPDTLAMMYQAPTYTSTANTYSFGHSNCYWAGSVNNWNHGTKVYGTTGTKELTTNGTTATSQSTKMTTNEASPATSTSTITMSMVQPYITCYMWKRTA